jgi:hypothetical protein|tara:strand:- start:1356 stop:1652 length:297 start_codon:yes stop_codon:yes gene_type:complete
VTGRLFEQSAAIIAKTKERHIRLDRRIQEDLAKINRFRPEEDPISIEEYLVGIFREGSQLEKSNALRNFKERLVLLDGELKLERDKGKSRPRKDQVSA